VTGHSDSDVALWQALRNLGDPVARDQLIARYGEFARMIAAKIYGMRPDDSVPFDDYLQYARVGLIEALDRYDLSRGTSFESYSSHRIRGSILSGLSQDTELRAQRSHWRELVAQRRESLAGRAAQESGKATLEDFARLAVGLAIGLMLEEPADERADESVEANPYAAAELSQMRERVRALVEQLPAREREVVRQHYYEQREFQEVAVRLGVTKGRVSQLHAQGVQRIREALNVRPRIDRKV
jgi:RNA polymerase sigma factor for flagellar operon FliA